MNDITAPLPDRAEIGALGVCQLKRLWARLSALHRGKVWPVDAEEGQLDRLALHGVGIGLEQALGHLGRQMPDFAAFERWIADTAGPLDPARVARLNAALLGRPAPREDWLTRIDEAAPVLDDAALAHWAEHGYVVLRDAIPPELAATAAAAVFAHLQADPAQPDSWYGGGARQGIMVQLFQHLALAAIRRSPRIHKAFAQLWGSADLWPSTDRVGFNPPQRPAHPFQGPHLHWDVSLIQPIPFATQGLIYLTDTLPEQGALTLVPGFQHRIADWLAGLPPDADPRTQDLDALGAIPIGGKAGDMVIWQQALPHGSRPNLATQPRVVHYLNWYPARIAQHETWR
ncbi:phytanoyl-CoA dioxygenase family protein [Chitiniphilus shinanonensis]|uniref:phytanoyl-CoA dioxygenase family protein n=1 Tax=Chitiniphilus shinanonensis TaxID=553088 RepID=UPI0030708C39